MSTALYQKYRPTRFSELIGQNHIKITLQNEISQGTIGHAYLFYGPRAVGKTSTARLFAKVVNCENIKEGESESCDDCESCKEISAGRSLDIIEIDAASHTGVDNVRENIIANAQISTAKRKYKVFVIDEVHMLSTSAFNALLKTLEEPPRNVIFILATTELHKVPATIISRCQRFDFKKISTVAMIERLKSLVRLEGKQVDDVIYESIARQSGGHVRDAESLLSQVLSLDDKIITAEQAEIIIPPSNFNLIIEFVEYLINKDKARAIEQINNLVNDGVDLVQFSNDLVEFLRKLLFSKISDTLDNFVISLDRELEEKVGKMKNNIELEYLIRALNTFIVRSKELKESEITQLPLEIGIIELIENISKNSSNNTPNIKDKNNVSISSEQVLNNNRPASLEQNVIQKNVQEKRVFNFNLNSEEKVDNNEVDVSTNGKINLEFLMNKWPEVINEVRKNEPALSFMLGAAKPKELKGDILEIVFKHQFHAESIKINGKQEKLEKIIHSVVGEKLRIKCSADLTINIDSVKVAPQINEENSELKNIDDHGEGDLGAVLEMFGGKVVG